MRYFLEVRKSRLNLIFSPSAAALFIQVRSRHFGANFMHFSLHQLIIQVKREGPSVSLLKEVCSKSIREYD